MTYKTTGKIKAPCILIFEFLLDEIQEDKELFCGDRWKAFPQFTLLLISM
jgi:hypothetical protein